MKGYENRWEARVTLNYRLIFSTETDAYVLFRAGTHDLLGPLRSRPGVVAPVLSAA